MKFKLILSLLAIGILTVSCVNKDLDLDKYDSEMTLVPGLTTTVKITESMTARLEDVIKQDPHYDPSLEIYGTDAQGNYKTDLLPDFESSYIVKKDFDINQYVKGLDEKVKTLSAVVTFEIESGVAIPFLATVEGDGETAVSHTVPAKGNSSFTVNYKNVINVKQIEASMSTSYKKGTPVTLNKNDQVKVSITQAVITLPDGVTIKL